MRESRARGRGAAGDWSDVRTEHEIDRMIQVEYRWRRGKTDRAPTGGRRSSLCPHRRSGGLGCSKQRQQPRQRLGRLRVKRKTERGARCCLCGTKQLLLQRGFE